MVSGHILFPDFVDGARGSPFDRQESWNTDGCLELLAEFSQICRLGQLEASWSNPREVSLLSQPTSASWSQVRDRCHSPGLQHLEEWRHMRSKEHWVLM